MADVAPSTVRLDWVRTHDALACIDGDAASQALTARLGRPLTPSPATRPVGERRIEVLLARDGVSWTARVSLRARPDEPPAIRDFRSEEGTCAALTDASVLAIALWIDPDSLARMPATEPAPLPPPRAPVSEAPRPAPSRMYGLFGRVDLAIGTLAALSPGFGASTDLTVTPSLPWLRARVNASVVPDARTSGARAGLALALAHVGLDACADPYHSDRVRLGACLGVAAGALQVTVLDPLLANPANLPGARAWGAAHLDGAVSVRIAGPAWVELAFGAWVPFARRRFTVAGRPEETAELFAEPFVSARASLAVGVRFP